MDAQISPPVNYFNITNFSDQSQHPPYVPSLGLAPNPVHATNGSDGFGNMHWNYGVEPQKKRVKEQDLLENNSQTSSLDFMQPNSVSTGLGLSLDNGYMTSSSDSALLSVIGDHIEKELQRQEMEIDRFLKIQGDRLRLAVLDKVQANQVHTISYIEKKVLKKLLEKEAELESINRKNIELEDQMEQLSIEAGAWQQRAKYYENMINTLKFKLQQVYTQNRDTKEGCGDSEINDTASCCNGRALDFHVMCNPNSNDRNELVRCRVCRVNEVRMLLWPCKHLCLCKDCESEVSSCPVCQSSKFVGMEVYV